MLCCESLLKSAYLFARYRSLFVHQHYFYNTTGEGRMKFSEKEQEEV